MLRHATIAPGRAWYTWSDRPAEMVFLPLGLRLTPLAYAASTGRATLFPPGPAVRLGRHDPEAGLVQLELDHAGTRLAWAWDKDDPFTLAGSWHTLARGEWGLRFWINLCLSAEDGTAAVWDASGAALLTIGTRTLALVSDEAPVQITGHATVAAAAEDYETNGYFNLASRAVCAPVLMLRFNLEMSASNRFAAALADSPARAIATAQRRLERPALAGVEPQDTGAGGPAAALAAVRDVVSWNTVWDAANRRPYTSISRNWNGAKFGGWGVWLDDQFYAALLAGYFDADLARDNVAAGLASATPQGNFACLVTARDAWVDRSQLPVVGFLLHCLALRTATPALEALAYPALARNHAWWWENRDPLGAGLCSFGTSDVGEGLYKGTSFGARNESSMDNSPMHDELPYDPTTRCLAGFDVGLNALLALDAEMLAAMARGLGRRREAEAHEARAAATRRLIRERLWDPTRGLFANRLWSGAFVSAVTPTSLFPLIAGAAAPEQVSALCRSLEDPALFGGRFGLPAVARSHPAYRDNTYWRGRIWPPLNFLVWHGLRRVGRHAEAEALARTSAELFDAGWAERRICAENYNAETGEPLDQPDTDGFYSWGALLPAMSVGQFFDVDPWHGWSLLNTGDELRLGPLLSPAGKAELSVSAGTLSLTCGEFPIFSTNILGRFTELSFNTTRFCIKLPARPAPEGFIRIDVLSASQVVDVRYDGISVSWEVQDDDGLLIRGSSFGMGGRLLQVIVG